MGATAPADLDRYATQFDEIRVEERTPIIDLNAINPLSSFREDWQNTSNTTTEHQLSTSADTNDQAFLETNERGQYTSGYQVQAGIGVRVPSTPTGDSEIRWGYYESDSNEDPLNGFYFGVDSGGVFVAKARNGSEEKVYQDNWNRDTLNGEEGSNGPNPSGVTLDLSNGQVFQIEFVYYGYGSIEMQILVDNESADRDSNSELITAHVFQPDGETSIENTNLPIRQDIDSGGSTNDALDLFVGGRQFSTIGKRTSNNRIRRIGLDSLSIDDDKWYAAISLRLKDGSGGSDGAIDFTHVLAELFTFEVTTETERARWALRRDTTPDNPSWNQSPSDIDDDEIAIKYDVNSADVQDGGGSLTGDFVNGGRLSTGKNNSRELVRSDSVDARITPGETVTLLFRTVSGQGVSSLQDIVFKWEEKW